MIPHHPVPQLEPAYLRETHICVIAAGEQCEGLETVAFRQALQGTSVEPVPHRLRLGLEYIDDKVVLAPCRYGVTPISLAIFLSSTRVCCAEMNPGLGCVCL